MKNTIFSLYQKGTFEFILKEDDINGLKDYINSYRDYPKEIIINTNDEKWNCRTTHYEHINLLDFCGFYSSIRCFKFFKVNGLKYGNFIQQMSIVGGNFEILHEIEQDGFSFDHFFEISVMYHHQNISEWLLSNYKCELICVSKCLYYHDYIMVLYLVLNNYDINKNDMNLIQPLTYLCLQKKVNIKAIEFFLDKGMDINSDSLNSPLSCLCSNKEFNFEAIQFFLDKGEDINESNKNPSALCRLCMQKKVNFEAIQFLLDHGADVNNSGSFYSALAYVCIQKEVNYEAIQFLLDRGADINKVFSLKYSPDQCTILGLLCNREHTPSIELLQFLLDKGADPNLGKNTPLEYLCKQKNTNIKALKLLIERGADPNLGDWTPLQNLCKQKETNIEAIKLLLDNGADPNQSDHNPLEYLCIQEEPNIEAIKLLIDKGADVNKIKIKKLETILEQINRDK